MNGSDEITSILRSLAGEEFCYLTTTGRVTGKPHDIEIWFGTQRSSIYLMAGDHKSDWVKNLLKDPSVAVRIAAQHFAGMARLVTDDGEEMTARQMIAYKYKELEADGSLSEWAQTALVVAIDLRILPA